LIDWKLLVDVATLLSVFVALAGLVFATRTFRHQMNVQLFLAFTERYGKALDAFPPEARQARLHPSAEPPPDSPELRKCVLRYLNLCSEEYHLYRHGYIARPVWEMWETKMKQAIRSKLFRRAWADLADEFNDHPEFGEFVQQVQAEGVKSV
jgi:hypothetical protein